MTDEELIARADANYFESFRLLAAASDDAETREEAGVLIVRTPVRNTWLNVAFVTRQLTDAESSLRRAIDYFDTIARPFVVRVREGVDPVAEHVAEELGLPFHDVVPGMVRGRVREIPPPMPGLEIHAVADEKVLEQHQSLVATSFGMPIEHARMILGPRVLAVHDAEFYVGYVDGEPVATSALIATHRVAGVYNVSCADSHRRRGIGEAMTWHAVRRGAAMGCIMASLQASEMGKPVYERMGFRTVAPYRTFVRPGS